MAKTTLAIIIPIKDRYTLTKQTIKSLLESITIPFKLIVVADACNEQTRKYIKSLRDDIIKVYTDEPVGVGKARNLGMEAAGDADYYYHSDCDMYFLPGWDTTLLETYKAFPEIGVLGGRKHPHHGILETLERGDHKVIVSDQQVGMSMFFSREVWQKVKETYGGFKHNEYSPHTMGQEDTAFCSQVQELGYKVGSVDPAVVLHCGIKNTFNMDTAGYEEELKQPFPEGVKYGIFD